MSHLFRLTPIIACVLLFALGGCDKEDGSSGKAPDPGKPVAKASQLSGSWYREGELKPGDTVGIEFAADGKTLTLVEAEQRGGVSEITVQYTLLEGGRARLSNPLMPAVTEVVIFSVNGDRLTAKGETSSEVLGTDGTFLRLKDKSIAVRHKERLAELVVEREAARKAAQEAHAKLRTRVAEFLQQKDVVLVPSDGGGPGSFRMVLDLKSEGGAWVGTGIHNGSFYAFQRRVQIDAPGAADGQVNLVVTTGEILGPPGAAQIRPDQFQLSVRDVNGTLEIKSATQTLRVDSTIAKDLRDQYAKSVAERRKIMDDFQKQIGDFAILEGELKYPNNPNARGGMYRLAMLRAPSNDAYLFTNYQPNMILTTASMGSVLPVVIAEEKGHLVFGQGQWIRKAAEGEDTFDAQIQGMVGTLKRTRSLSAEQMSELRNQFKAMVASMKTKPLVLSGAFFESYTYEHGKIRPVRFSLQSPDGTSVTGTYVAETFGIELPVTGRISESLLGLVLNLEMPAIKPMEHSLHQYVETGQLVLPVELIDGRLVVTGRMMRGDGANRFELTTPDADRTTALRKMLTDHINSGGEFKWSRTGYNSGDDIVTMKLTVADNKVSGTAALRKYTAPVSGEIKELDGQLVLEMMLEPAPGQARPQTGPMKLWVLRFGETFQLSGQAAMESAATKVRFVSFAPIKGG